MSTVKEIKSAIEQDPIDRHIVSTALAHDVPVMTVDKKIHELAPKIGLRVIWWVGRRIQSRKESARISLRWAW